MFCAGESTKGEMEYRRLYQKGEQSLAVSSLSLIKQDGGRVCGSRVGYLDHKEGTDRFLLKGKMVCTAPVLHCPHVFLPEMTPLLRQIPLYSRSTKCGRIKCKHTV